MSKYSSYDNLSITSHNTLYDVLHVPRSASTWDIKAAYKKLAMEYHPDKTNGDPDKTEAFKTVAHAYTILSDTQKRLDYDTMGNAYPTASQLHVDVSMEHLDDLLDDVFAEITSRFMMDPEGAPFVLDPSGTTGEGDFPFSHMFQRQWIQNDLDTTGGTDVAPEEVTVTVSLEEVYHGCRKSIDYTITDACCACNTADPSVRCLECKGGNKGCTSCGGNGVWYAKPCTLCHGKRAVRSPRQLHVHIPRGVPNGYRFAMKDKGSILVPACNYADLVVVISYDIPPHIHIDAPSGNITCALDVSLVDVICGFHKTLCLYGEDLVLDCSRGCPQAHLPLVFKGKGLPHYKTEGCYGDLVVPLCVRFPAEKTMKKLQPIFETLFHRKSKDQVQGITPQPPPPAAL